MLYIVLSRERCGSNLLVNYINQLTDATVINSKQWFSQPSILNNFNFIDNNVVVKTHHKKMISIIVPNNSVSLIIADRRDCFGAVMSTLVADHTNQWGVDDYLKNIKVDPFWCNYHTFAATLLYRLQWYANIENEFSVFSIKKIYYEDIIEGGAAYVANFLGVDQQSNITISTVPSPHSYTTLITNWKELKTAFSHCLDVIQEHGLETVCNWKFDDILNQHVKSM